MCFCLCCLICCSIPHELSPSTHLELMDSRKKFSHLRAVQLWNWLSSMRKRSTNVMPQASPNTFLKKKGHSKIEPDILISGSRRLTLFGDFLLLFFQSLSLKEIPRQRASWQIVLSLWPLQQLWPCSPVHYACLPAPGLCETPLLGTSC